MNDPAADSAASPPNEFAGHGLPRDMLTPALRSDPEAFPVITAFREYLEEERERARRRLVTVSAIAISAIVLIVVGFLAVGTLVIGNLMRRNDLLQETVLRAAVRDTATPVPAAAPATAQQQDEVARINETLRRMQQENAALRELPGILTASMGQTLSNFVAQSRTVPVPAARALPPPPTSPFAPPNTLATTAPAPATPPATSTLPAPAATPRTTPAVVTSASSPTSSPAERADAAPPAPVTVSVPTRSSAAPKIEGYAPANLTLVTDRGVAIPWRIVVPE